MSKRLGRPIQTLLQQDRQESALGLEKYTLYNRVKRFIIFAYQNFMFVCNLKKGLIFKGSQMGDFARILYERDLASWQNIQQLQFKNFLRDKQKMATVSIFYIQTIKPSPIEKQSQMIALGVQQSLVKKLFQMLQTPSPQQRLITASVQAITKSIKTILQSAQGNNNNATKDTLGSGKSHADQMALVQEMQTQVKQKAGTQVKVDQSTINQNLSQSRTIPQTA